MGILFYCVKYLGTRTELNLWTIMVGLAGQQVFVLDVTQPYRFGCHSMLVFGESQLFYFLPL